MIWAALGPEGGTWTTWLAPASLTRSLHPACADCARATDRLRPISFGTWRHAATLPRAATFAGFEASELEFRAPTWGKDESSPAEARLREGPIARTIVTTTAIDSTTHPPVPRWVTVCLVLLIFSARVEAHRLGSYTIAGAPCNIVAQVLVADRVVDLHLIPDAQPRQLGLGSDGRAPSEGARRSRGRAPTGEGRARRRRSAGAASLRAVQAGGLEQIASAAGVASVIDPKLPLVNDQQWLRTTLSSSSDHLITVTITATQR